MNVGIVGSGNMGRTLGVVWSEHGHEVFFGSRDRERAERAAMYARTGMGAGSNDEAAAFGDLIVWTVRGVPAGEVLSDVESLRGKIVVDVTNAAPRDDYRLGPQGDELSLAEQLAAQLPGARVVKAFNTIAMEVFELSPTPLRDFGVTAYIAGDDDAAKATVSKLAQRIGFLPLDCGPLACARSLEGLGDFARYTMTSLGAGPFVALSLHPVPQAKGQRFGGRQKSTLA
jgi:predicted dinucleotide-binding enzyme